MGKNAVVFYMLNTYDQCRPKLYILMTTIICFINKCGYMPYLLFYRFILEAIHVIFPLFDFLLELYQALLLLCSSINVNYNIEWMQYRHFETYHAKAKKLFHQNAQASAINLHRSHNSFIGPVGHTIPFLLPFFTLRSPKQSAVGGRVCYLGPKNKHFLKTIVKY